MKIVRQHQRPAFMITLAWSLLTAFLLPVAAAETNYLSRVIEVSGKVELRRSPSTNWQALAVKAMLAPGDQVRTGPDSRAAIELSDRSIVRVSPNSILLLQPPRGQEQRRFRLEAGKIFLFNRAQPSSVEFETPLATGAIRGTEFVLSAGADGGRTDLEMVDGRVELNDARTIYQLASGEGITLEPNQPPAKRKIAIARSLPPWAMHFPMVLVKEDLAWVEGEAGRIAASLALYDRGKPQAALAALPVETAVGDATKVFHTALLTAVGSTTATTLSAAGTDTNGKAARAINRLIQVVQGDTSGTPVESDTATEWLVESWARQHDRDPEGALDAARNAARLRPSSGLVWQRIAELAFGLDRLTEAAAAIDRSLEAAPDLAAAHALRGYLLLDRARLSDALAAFDRAVELDPSSGGAWLGRGLTQQRLSQKDAAHQSLQCAAALEPQKSAYRIALARSFSTTRENELAEKELRLARTLNPNDPSTWLHSALQHWQQNRPNEAVRELETSLLLNDDRAVFRSDNLLDRDRAIRSANLAAIYREVGFEEAALRLAIRATTDAYTDFSGHLLLANFYRDLEDPNAFDLRFETTRFSEQLMASLLAPPGAGNLSLVLDQQEHLRYLDPPRFGIGSRTDYRSNGDWWQRASVFGNEGQASYAFDVDYRSRNGEQPNGWLEQRWLSLQWKINLTLRDQLYVQGGWFERENGDVARHYDPSNAKLNFTAQEAQRPSLLLGYHRTWSPEHHTLLLGLYIDDQFSSSDTEPSVLFLQQTGGTTTSVQTPGLFAEDFNSKFRLFSGEAQHIWTPGRHTLIGGALFQSGSTETHATLQRPLPPPVTDQLIDEPFQRADVYLYDQWQLLDSLSLIGGLTYSHVEYPVNADLAPLATGTESKDVLGPKVGAIWNPWKQGLVRAMYSRSIGGLYFDNSVRLEPTQLGGFNQTFRSLIPESVAGLVPGTEFDVVSIGIDQSLTGGVFLGAGFDWLGSDGERQVGVLTNSTILPIPDSAALTRQTLKFQERSFSVYAGWLLGDEFSVSARYRLSAADLESSFPEIPVAAVGLNQLEEEVTSILHHGQFNAQWQHPFGWFARWTSDWYQQSNAGYFTDQPGDDFWQHSIFAGYRLPGRQLQVQAGVLNLFDTDYRLAPLNYLPELPRHRTFVVSLRLNF